MQISNKQMEKNVEFKVGEETLRGKLFVPEGKGPFPGVIFFHGSGGSGGSSFEAASKLSEKRIMSFAFNFRGCGISDGDYLIQTHENGFEDASEAIKFFLSQSVDQDRLGFAGSSFGAYVASILLPQQNVKSMVFRAPSACMHDSSEKIDMGGLENEVKYVSDRKNWEDSIVYTNISKYKGSLLVVKSENDENIHSEVVEKYYKKASKASKKEIRTINGADHRLSTPEMREKYYKLTIEWFKETL